MTPERWRKLQHWLDAVFELPGSERTQFLEENCADTDLRREVISLVAAAESAATGLEEPLSDLVHAVDPREPQEVGPYRLLERLGEGGMGTVFVAQRTDDVHHRQVAVKLLQVGLNSAEVIRRFEREREILAQLEHPNIAHLLDGGTAPDGRPYLVMEKVQGLPIDRYCEEQQLDLNQRLRLFQKVCAAVHFAHQQLVVHRDLKFANILVTDEGEPKLLDFGIAKLLSAEGFPLTVVTTVPGRSPMTPAWASPEQMRGEGISTATDIYSLGVLLYRLLSGQRPYDLEGRTYAEAVRVVCEEEPSPPSQVAREETAAAVRVLRKRLAGDLDDIVLKALRKDPQRRYGSAEQLAQDLERYLMGLPVLAHKGSFAYHASKFVRRHRVGVASTATAFLLLLVFLALLLEKQREVVAERDRFEITSRFLTNLFENPNPKRSLDPNLTARELLDRGAQALAVELAGQPEVEAEMRTIIGSSYHGLGRVAEAVRELEESLALRRRLYRADHPKIAETLARLAQVESDRGFLERAESLFREALKIRQGAFDPPHREVADSLFRLAWILEREGHYDVAENYYREALEQARQLNVEELLADILASFGILLREKGAYVEAEAMLEEALVLRRRQFGEHHARTADSLGSLGLLFHHRGRWEEAEKYFREALKTAFEVYEGPHRSKASLLASLANALARQGRYEEAEPLFLQAIAMDEAMHSEAHPSLATHLGQLAHLYERMARREEAAVVATRALEMRRTLFGNEHKDVALSCDYLGRILTHLEQFDEAGALFEEAMEIYRKTVGEAHPQMAKTLNNLASLEFQRGRQEKARELFRRALETLEAVHGAEHPEVGTMAFNLGFLHHEAGELDLAATYYQKAEENTRLSLGNEHPTLGIVLTRRGVLAADLDDPQAAEAAAREALEILAAKLPWEHNRRRHAELLLARSLLAQERYQEAEETLAKRYRWALEELGPEDPRTTQVDRQLEEIYRAQGKPWNRLLESKS